jgi:hypothetical protein
LRKPYVDHIVDSVERQMKEYELSNDDYIDLTTGLVDMIKEVQFARYFESKIL